MKITLFTLAILFSLSFTTTIEESKELIIYETFPMTRRCVDQHNDNEKKKNTPVQKSIKKNQSPSTRIQNQQNKN